MTDFDPVAKARNFHLQFVAGGRFTDEEYDEGVGWLCDYIDALVAALRETNDVLSEIEDDTVAEYGVEYSRDVERITHTNRHLLEG